MGCKGMEFIYGDKLILRFRRLKYQLNKLKSQKQIDKYSDIEGNQNQYITFKRFCNECEEYFSRRYCDTETEETIQEIFDKLC